MGQSRNENILENMLGAQNPLGEPQSREEAILQNMLGAQNPLGDPQSREEALLMQVLEQGLGGGLAGTKIEIISTTYTTA